MRVARVNVTADLLRRCLHFPPSVQFVGCAYSPMTDVIALLIRDDSDDTLPEVEGNDTPPTVWASYAVRQPACAEAARILDLYTGRPGGVVFVGWNPEPAGEGRAA